MSQPFDPRKMLKQLAIPLLRDFFRQRSELLDLPWDELRASRRIDPIYDAWQRLPDAARREVHIGLRDIHGLADGKGLQVIAEAIRTHAPDRVWEFTSCGSRLNKALWFYLNFRELFDQVGLFAHADALSTGRYAIRRNSLPKHPIVVTPEITLALGNALRDYYWSQQLRGERCRVEHYTRSDGNEYFFAYLDDWPDAPLVFAENGKLEPLPARYAFSVLFVFCPQDGSLEFVAKGGRAIHYPLQRAFCQSVLGLDVGPADPLRPAYDLGVLLDPDFAFPTDPGDRIAQVRLAKIRLASQSEMPEVKSKEIEFGKRVGRRRSLELIQQDLDALGLTRAQAFVKQAALEFRFVPWSGGRPGQMTINITVPNTCDLKDKPEELQGAGGRCLKMWGILCA
jgi:hypothetical protein